MKYALLTDNSVQWFHYLVEIKNEKATCAVEIPTGMNNDFLSNLCQREKSFSNLKLEIQSSGGNTWYGNYISKYEFDRLIKMIDLFPKVQEYERLGRLESI